MEAFARCARAHPGFACVWLVLLTLALAGCEEKRSPSAKNRQESQEARGEEDFEGTIVAVGDSLTAGYGVAADKAYPARLQERLLAEGFRYRVINAGVSGETSSGTLSRIDWIMTLDPDIVILETGANDGLRGIPAELIEKNLNEIVRILKERNVTVVLAGMQMVGNLGRGYTEELRKVYPRVAEKQGISLIPFFLESVAGNPELNQQDSIHPTAEGYGIVANHVYPYVVEAIEKRRDR
jgi:acyl-CoA thioesterase-1